MEMPVSPQTDSRPGAEVVLSVPSMMCEGCAEKIRGALMALPGVRAVTAKLWRKRVHVHYEPTRIDTKQLVDALGNAGFAATEA
jgi:copper chaperone